MINIELWVSATIIIIKSYGAHYIHMDEHTRVKQLMSSILEEVGRRGRPWKNCPEPIRDDDMRCLET